MELINFTEFNDLLSRAAEQNNVNVAVENCEQLFSFLELLLSENEKYNLTAIKQPADAVYKHIIDSILLAEHLPKGVSVVDVGCGAGFPSLPLAVVRPDLRITSMDSTAKKVNFIQMCVDKLALGNVSPVCGRAEELAFRPEFRDKFDVATARAVANLPVLCELCLPFVKPNGRFVAMKGRFPAEEFNISAEALAKLSAEGMKIREYELATPDSGEQRTLVTITKIGKTKDNFPRKYSVITKNPLK